MDSQIISAIITGGFGLLTGVIVAKIEYFSLPFRKSKRQLMKNWEGYAQRAVFNKNSTSEENKNKCTMTVV